jgi:AcrR family transcriptional regulator
MAGKTKTRPGGRSARVRGAVMEALLTELVEKGLGAVTIEGIARRAGVNKTTLYRRWGSKEKLVLEAMLERGEQLVPIPDTGRLRDDLLTVAREIAASLATPESEAIVRAGASEPSASAIAAAARSFWEVRFRLLAQMVERATARGEVPADTDPKPTVEGLLAGIYLRLLVTREPLDDEFLTGLAERLAACARANPQQVLSQRARSGL